MILEGRGLSADFLKRTQARYEAGTAAKLDVIKAQVDLAQADSYAADSASARSLS